MINSEGIAVPVQKIYRYSLIWRLGIFCIPPVSFLFALVCRTKVEVVQEQLNAESLLANYELVLIILAGLIVVPYLLFCIKFSRKFIISDSDITEKGLFRSRNIQWKDVFEYRDMLFEIVLMPVDRKNIIDVDNYCNIKEIKQFNREIVHHCRQAEVNMMIRPMTRNIMPINPGIYPTFLLMIFLGLAVMFFNVEAVFMGIAAGVVYVFLSFSVSLIQRRFGRDEDASKAIHLAIYFLLGIAPVIILINPLWDKSFGSLVIQCITYIAGYLAGSEIMTLLLMKQREAKESGKVLFPDEGRPD